MFSGRHRERENRGCPIPKRAPPSLEDVLKFIRSRLPQERSTCRKNPFVGKRFHRSLVQKAIEELRRTGCSVDLEPFDLKGTLYLWKGREGRALARKATKRLVDCLRARLADVTLERILPEINLRAFHRIPIDRYGTTLGGMLANVYGNGPYQAIKDLIEHDPEFAPFRDFQPWDMRKAPQKTWITAAGKRNYAGARELTRRCLEAIAARRPHLAMEDLLAKIEVCELLSTPVNKYGTKLGGMLDEVYDHSPYLALRDMAEHHPRYRKYVAAIDRRRYRSRKALEEVSAQTKGTRHRVIRLA